MTEEQRRAAEQHRMDEEFESFCHENGVDPEQADDTDMAEWLQRYINTQEKVINV